MIKKAFIVTFILTVFLPMQAFGIIVMSHNNNDTNWLRATTPILTRVANGSLLAVFTNASKEGSKFGGIWGKYSDDGYVWNERFLIMASTEEYSVAPDSLLTLNNKTMLFYVRFVRFDSIQEASVWLTESMDNGISWTNDRRVDSGHFSYTVGTYQVLTLRNGTLIFPMSWLVRYDRGLVWGAGFLRSDDGGNSWFDIGTISDVSGFPIGWTGFDEPCAVELNDSSLYCLLRSSEKWHMASRSYDCGLTWTIPQIVPEMNAVDTTPAIVRVNDSLVVAAWINRSSKVLRSPLALACSFDDCKTWNLTRIVEADRSVNDMSFYVDGERVFLSYRQYDERSVLTNDDAMVVIFDSVSWGSFVDDYSRTDFNHDHKTDIFDGIVFSYHFNEYNSTYDLNGDLLVDVFDAMILSQNWS